MPFECYSRTDGEVKACQLLISTEQDIADALSKASTMGALASLQAVRSNVTNCLEFTFRYRENTTLSALVTTDWLIEQPNGRYLIKSNREFVREYFNTDIDYEIPILKREDVKSAFLEYVNKTFPELYANNYLPSVAPYESIALSSVSTNEKFVGELAMNSAVINPAVTGQTGGETAGGQVTLEYSQTRRPTAYMVGMHGNSYNAPTSWTITAYNIRNEPTVVAEIQPGDLKSGIYKIETPANCYKLVFDFHSFELPANEFNTIRLLTFTGGEVVAPPTPVPLTKLSRDTLELVAEKLLDWYDPATNVYTMDLSTAGITDFGGFGRIFKYLMNASFINPNTKVKINLSNAIQQANVTDITLTVGFALGTDYAGQIPNQFDPITLQQMVAEVNKLSKVNADRIIEIDFAPSQPYAVPTIQKCVTANTTLLWDEFVENMISLTGISQPSQIHR